MRGLTLSFIILMAGYNLALTGFCFWLMDRLDKKDEARRDR